MDGLVHNGDGKKAKLHGRAFYESIGSPKVVVAPMVEQSEFAWRLLCRSFVHTSPSTSLSPLHAYTPMFHSKLFHTGQKYRDACFQPLKMPLPDPVDPYHISQLPPSSFHLDGNPSIDRPLVVQFCSNDADDFVKAAKYVTPFCDAVNLNLGCPQGIAKRGGYGSFLQEHWDVISSIIRKAHEELDVPVTAKIRIQETREKTLAYAKMILDAGASILTIHGRRREQKGHNTGLADWSHIRYIRDNLPPETVIFANGNILQHEDIAACLIETGADAVMVAEGCLHDPTIFAEPPKEGEEGDVYWKGVDGKRGYRVDAVMRRYFDIIWKYALQTEPPNRKPLWVPGAPEIEEETTSMEELPHKNDITPSATDTNTTVTTVTTTSTPADNNQQPPNKKRKLTKSERKQDAQTKNPNLTAMQAHLFHLLRPLVAVHHDVRDALARCRVGDMRAFENVLRMVEEKCAEGMREYERDVRASSTQQETQIGGKGEQEEVKDNAAQLAAFEADPHESSRAAVERCRRPWWVCQAYVRPVPKEAIERGAMKVGKKELKRLEREKEGLERSVGLKPGGRVEVVGMSGEKKGEGEVSKNGAGEGKEEVEIPREGVVCG
ncbi:FMN-linked oxidoreductase [Sporormia fimetaria CBS 119925]|uniref:tRNA-dihydrouridine(16/17) synthase [NAD(P)(+)] n=1 Tax=Sporormia fimetaria CBS 119925 TaxID=1340428 RepID=A0A6A6V1V6_9PLEO|nr:FMN-linked oxidoreductase [Sporormia fimetaria CBS 119925]